MENKTAAVSGFHHVALKCCDIEKSLTMYRALGLKEVLAGKPFPWEKEEKPE